MATSFLLSVTLSSGHFAFSFVLVRTRYSAHFIFYLLGTLYSGHFASSILAYSLTQCPVQLEVAIERFQRLVIPFTSTTCQHQTKVLASAPSSLFGPPKIPNIGTKCEWLALCHKENSVAPIGQKNERTLDKSTFNTEQEKCLILPHIKLPFTGGPACSISHYNVFSHPDSVPQGLVSHLTLQ